MTAQIIKSYTESFSKMRLIGKRYTDDDRVEGSFGAKWSEWHANAMFAPLEDKGCLAENGDAHLGAMRIFNGIFEYWIGMFYPANTEVPDGYQYADIEPLNFAVFWLYGNEQNGELYGMDNHNMCLDEIEKQGLSRKEDGWCFERYTCPRYTTPDDRGNVILDYGISIESAN